MLPFESQMALSERDLVYNERSYKTKTFIWCVQLAIDLLYYCHVLPGQMSARVGGGCVFVDDVDPEFFVRLCPSIKHIFPMATRLEIN